MKKILITNGILSLLLLLSSTLCYLLPIILWLSPLFWFSIFGLLIASFVMGIVTLASKQDERVKGLTIASGILAILSGCLGVNAIISLIAVIKINGKIVETIDKETIKVEGEKLKGKPNSKAPAWFSEFNTQLNKRLNGIEKDMKELKSDVEGLKIDMKAIKNTPTMKRELKG